MKNFFICICLLQVFIGSSSYAARPVYDGVLTVCGSVTTVGVLHSERNGFVLTSQEGRQFTIFVEKEFLSNIAKDMARAESAMLNDLEYCALLEDNIPKNSYILMKHTIGKKK